MSAERFIVTETTDEEVQPPVRFDGTKEELERQFPKKSCVHDILAEYDNLPPRYVIYAVYEDGSLEEYDPRDYLGDEAGFNPYSPLGPDCCGPDRLGQLDYDDGDGVL